MLTLPSPLHPAIVHFPIVLLLLGACVAVVSVVLNRWHLPWIAAVLLALGSVGAFVAAETGEDAEDLAGELAGPAKTLFEAHEEWAERTEAAGAAAAVLAIAAAGLGAFASRKSPQGNLPSVAGPTALPKAALALRAVAAVAALTACYFVYETGHAGGKLVYEYGVGVKTTAAQPGQSPVRPGPDTSTHHERRAED